MMGLRGASQKRILPVVLGRGRAAMMECASHRAVEPLDCWWVVYHILRHAFPQPERSRAAVARELWRRPMGRASRCVAGGDSAPHRRPGARRR